MSVKPLLLFIFLLFAWPSKAQGQADFVAESLAKYFVAHYEVSMELEDVVRRATGLRDQDFTWDARYMTNVEPNYYARTLSDEFLGLRLIHVSTLTTHHPGYVVGLDRTQGLWRVAGFGDHDDMLPSDGLDLHLREQSEIVRWIKTLIATRTISLHPSDLAIAAIEIQIDDEEVHSEIVTREPLASPYTFNHGKVIERKWRCVVPSDGYIVLEQIDEQLYHGKE